MIEQTIINKGHSNRQIKKRTEFLKAGSLSSVKIYLQVKTIGKVRIESERVQGRVKMMSRVQSRRRKRGRLIVIDSIEMCFSLRRELACRPRSRRVFAFSGSFSFISLSFFIVLLFFSSCRSRFEVRSCVILQISYVGSQS